MTNRTLYYCELHGLHQEFPVLTLIWSQKGIVRLIFGNKNSVAKERSLQESKPNTNASKQATRFLKGYFSGKKGSFDLPSLDEQGSVFQKKVWNSIRKIGFGKTQAYAQVAKTIGKSRAFRAVGRATGANPIPIFTPCHRVIGTNGSLVGFTGGLNRKKALLALEGNETVSRQNSVATGFR